MRLNKDLMRSYFSRFFKGDLVEPSRHLMYRNQHTLHYATMRGGPIAQFVEHRANAGNFVANLDRKIPAGRYNNKAIYDNPTMKGYNRFVNVHHDMGLRTNIIDSNQPYKRVYQPVSYLSGRR